MRIIYLFILILFKRYKKVTAPLYTYNIIFFVLLNKVRYLFCILVQEMPFKQFYFPIFVGESKMPLLTVKKS